MARLFSMISGWEASTKSLSRGAAEAFFMGATLKLRLASAHKKSPTQSVRLLVGRDGEIRTHDPLHPMQVFFTLLFLDIFVI
jgi:hypothetical protein